MTLTKAVKILSSLGFQVDDNGGYIRGRISAEAFNSYPIKILSPPYRDIFVGQTKKGWLVNSYINFRGKHIHEKTTHFATILNIMGSGITLAEAVDDFVERFNNKVYSDSKANTLEGVPSGMKRLVGPIL